VAECLLALLSNPIAFFESARKKKKKTGARSSGPTAPPVANFLFFIFLCVAKKNKLQVTLLFLDAINRAIRADQQHHNPNASHDVRTDTAIHAKLFYAERNMYLCGSTLMMSLVLNRFVPSPLLLFFFFLRPAKKISSLFSSLFASFPESRNPVC
jgi:hypothetical protein